LQVESLLRQVARARLQIARNEKASKRRKAYLEGQLAEVREHISKLEGRESDLQGRINVNEENRRQEQSKIEEAYETPRKALIRQISLCSIKHALASEKSKPLEGKGNVIYQGSFMAVYQTLGSNNKPVNSTSCTIFYEYTCSEKIRWRIEKLDNGNGLQSGWRGDANMYAERDFPTEEAATKWFERNKDRIVQPLLDKIRGIEHEINAASDDMDQVFDFRLLFDDRVGRDSYQDDRYTVVSKERHMLTVMRPVANDITITQQGFTFTLSEVRFPRDAEQLYGWLESYFNVVPTWEPIHSIAGMT
jgi:hypothetical protein